MKIIPKQQIHLSESHFFRRIIIKAILVWYKPGVGIRAARPGPRKSIPTGLSPPISIPIGLAFPIPIPARSGRAEPYLSPIFEDIILLPSSHGFPKFAKVNVMILLKLPLRQLSALR